MEYSPLARKLGELLLPPPPKAKRTSKKEFEITYFIDDNCKGDPVRESYYSKIQALKRVEELKNYGCYISTTWVFDDEGDIIGEF